MTLLLSQNFKFFILYFVLFALKLSAVEDSILNKQEQEWIKNNPVVVFGADYSWAPYDFVDQSGKHNGIASDFLKLISQKSGLKFDIKPNVWSEVMSDLKAGRLDGLTCAAATPERIKFLNFTTPYSTMPLAIIVREENQDIKSVDDLAGKRVSVNKGSYLHEWLTKNHPEIKLLLTTSNNDSLEALSFSTADAYIGNIAVASYIINEKFLTNLKIIGKIELDTQVSVAIDKNKPMLFSIIEKTLATITNDERSKIVQKWFVLSNSSKEAIGQSAQVGLNAREREWLDLHKGAQVGVDANWAPFDFIDKDGRHKGISADYLALISKKTGLNFEIIKNKTWDDTLKAAKQKRLEIISCLSKDAQRDKYLDYSKAYFDYSFVLATIDTHEFVHSLDSFDKKSLGVVKGYITESILHTKYPEVEVVTFDDIDKALDALAQKRIDGVFDNAATIAYAINKKGYSHLKIAATIGEKRSLYIGVVKPNPILLSIINKGLDSITPKERKEISNKWLSFKYVKEVDYSLLFGIAGILILLLLLISYWNRRLAREINERKLLEKSLKESKLQTERIIDSMPLNIVVTRYDGTILRVTPQALKDFGVASQLISKYNIKDFYLDTAERDKVLNIVSQEGQVHNQIVSFVRPDGREIKMMLSVIPIEYDAQKALLGIAVDLTKRIETEEALREAKDYANAANRIKSEFLANMSHEIRTPMNAIMGFTELLSEEVVEPKQKSYLNTIRSAGDSLLTLINDILDLSKIEAGKLVINKKATNIYGLADELSSIFRIETQSKGIDLLVEVDESLPQSLLIDEIRLRQVLFNLLGNAVKFTHQGYIKLVIKKSNIKSDTGQIGLNIDIEDSGIGIAKDQQKMIFDAFMQPTGQDIAQYGGTGLGLSISKHLMDMMDGSISLKSQVDRGSTFSIYLNNIDIVPSRDDKQNSKIERLKQRNIDFHPAKILIVDDISSNRELIADSLTSTKLKVITASSGREAIDISQRERPDLILMDIRMPTIDGYEATSKIKSLCDVPIIALTASVMPEEESHIKKSDFDGFLRKPISRNDLIGELSKFLKYNEVETTIPTKEREISKKARDNMDSILKILQDEITPLCNKVLTNHNISQTKEVAFKLKKLGERYDIDMVTEYGALLKESIDNFNIKTMQRVLYECVDIDKRLKAISTKGR